VADPFLYFNDKNYHMFFEVMNNDTSRGEIGLAISPDGIKWDYQQIVLKENFHLSYPKVFKWEGDIYLLPESHEDFSVRLYKAINFPLKWEHIGNILNGYSFIDNTIFYHNELWWMFVNTGGTRVLNLYYSNNLYDGWQPHPMNPLIKKNRRVARNGGSVIKHEDKIYRLAQDCYPYYGVQVFAYEIITLTSETYEEILASDRPIVTKSGKGWNAMGMHHVDAVKINGRWLAAVDGQS